MSLAFENAQKVVKETKVKIRHADSNDITDELSEKELKQGQFSINVYLEEEGENEPDLLGMRISVDLYNKDFREKMNNFAEKRGLKAEHYDSCCHGRYSKLYKVKRGILRDSKKQVAYFSDRYFTAYISKLFEEIGTELLGLKT